MKNNLSKNIGKKLRKNKETLAVAESCTGGFLGSVITEVAGSSDYFLGGVIVYKNKVKNELLGVPLSDLKKYGAVSEVVAKKMAQGIRRRLKATYGLAITGIAGPGGGSKEKPVGLVFIALSSVARTICKNYIFTGSRSKIRQQAVEKALRLI